MEPAESNPATAPTEQSQNQGFKITIIDQTGSEIKLGVVQCELITELREMLLENVNTMFFTNYYFEHKGERMEEY
jgi:hypothetical protein